MVHQPSPHQSSNQKYTLSLSVDSTQQAKTKPSQVSRQHTADHFTSLKKQCKRFCCHLRRWQRDPHPLLLTSPLVDQSQPATSPISLSPFLILVTLKPSDPLVFLGPLTLLPPTEDPSSPSLLGLLKFPHPTMTLRRQSSPRLVLFLIFKLQFGCYEKCWFYSKFNFCQLVCFAFFIFCLWIMCSCN